MNELLKKYRLFERLGGKSLLPSYFSLIDDEGLYPPRELAEYIGASEETIRRWCRNGYFLFEGETRYQIQGIEIKLFLLKKQLPRLKNYKELFPTT